MDQNRYDYIVIGAGSAGCVVAARLSKAGHKTVLIEAGGKDGFLDELYLQESYRGLGIGRRAVDFAIQMCPKLGIKRISLEVEPHNERAKRLYINSGFFTHNRILMSYWID